MSSRGGLFDKDKLRINSVTKGRNCISPRYLPLGFLRQHVRGFSSLFGRRNPRFSSSHRENSKQRGPCYLQGPLCLLTPRIGRISQLFGERGRGHCSRANKTIQLRFRSLGWGPPRRPGIRGKGRADYGKRFESAIDRVQSREPSMILFGKRGERGVCRWIDWSLIQG